MKEALFILIQQNLVQYQIFTEETSPSRPVLYRFLVEAAITRLLYPLFAALLQGRFGTVKDEASQVFLEVAKHGRLAVSLLSEDLRPIAKRMLQEDYFALVLPSDSIYESSSERTDACSFSSPAKKRSAAANLTPPSHITSLSPKRPRYTKSIDGDLSPSSYLCINAKVFINAIWQERLIEYVTGRLNATAGAVVRAALTCIGMKREATFTPFQITTKLPSGIELLVDQPSPLPSNLPEITAEKSPVMHYLDSLSQEVDFINKEDFRSGGIYSISHPRAVARLRVSLIETLITARFGQPSTRIFRVLLDRGMLEERTISKVAMMAAKETRERLYQLLQYGLLHMQEVPKTADHAPSRTFFLWTIPLALVYARLSELALKMWINLRERALLHRNKNEMLILKSERSDVAANPALLADAEQRQLRGLQRTLDRLDGHGNRIAEELLLLRFLTE